MDESVTKLFVKECDTARIYREQRTNLTGLRLSEAIRRGAKIRPKAVGKYLYDGRSCALGAAREAVFPDVSKWVGATAGWAEKYFGLTEGIIANVIRLNDGCDWTREAIADFLEEQGL